jgi:DEAD/DEAH box helicase domain-containing protein
LIVIDEMHVYRGVFGSHVANVIRRLMRLCSWRRSRPQIIGCSATIGNPKELFERLTGRRPVLIDEDGSGHARRTFVFWNPPMIDHDKRASGNIVASEVLATLVEHKSRTLCFNRARVSTELVLRYTRKRLEAGGRFPPQSVESYRGGYTARERRQIETALFRGRLQGLAATNAMELGVDIGGLDAVVMNGYPGTIASFWQQAGRAGRGDRNGLAVFVAHEDPLEQFLVREPQLILNGANESVILRPDNEHVLAAQLRCAGYERPLAPSELDAFGPKALELAEAMDRAGDLVFRGGLFYFPSHNSPAAEVNIRDSGGEAVSLILNGEVLGTMDRWRAMQQAHEGAVYLHRGAGYLVRKLDLQARRAEVEAAEVPYFTRAIVQSLIEPDPPFEEKRCGEASLAFCRVTVTDSIDGYRRVSLDGERVLGVEPLDLPPSTFETIAVRFDLPASEDDLAGAISVHGLEHALMALAPLIAGCDRSDLGSSWYGVFPDTLRPALFVFDRTPGGIGLTQQLYQASSGWISGARQLIAGCPCQDGCPSCLLSAACASNNEFLDKGATLRLLSHLT